MNEILELFQSLVLSERGAGFFRATILLVGGFVLSRFAGTAAGRLLRHRFGPQRVVLARRLITYGLLALFTVSALREAGFDLTVLLGAAGVLTVALGFASQTSVSNLISGLFLIGERAFEIGESVTIGDVTGEVLSVDWMSVKLRTFDNLLVRLPNEAVLKSRITNLSRFPIRRLDQLVTVAYGTDMTRVRAVLDRVAAKNPLCLDEPKPLLHHKGFGDSAVQLQFSVWFLTANHLELRNQLPNEIADAFVAAGIDIPFPQRTVTVRNGDAPAIPATSPVREKRGEATATSSS